MSSDVTYTSDTLFALDHRGQIRIWFFEISGDKWCSTSGLLDGNHSTSKWKTEKGKGIGKSKTTAEQQARLAAESAYAKRLKTDYHEDIGQLNNDKYFAPMLAKTFKEFTDECWSSPKLDGHRLIATRNGLFSRNGEPIVTAPHIRAALIPVFTQLPHLVIDGELYNHEFKDSFEELSGLITTKKFTDEILELTREVLQFHIFDIFDKNDATMVKHERLMTMNAVFDECEFIKLVEFTYVETASQLDLLYNRYLKGGYEGQMVNSQEGVYEKSPLDYRSDGLLKRKETKSAEFPILAVHEGSGNWGGVAKTVTVDLGDGKVCEATLKGTRPYAKKVLDNADAIIGTLGTVDFFGYTADGLLRFPRVRVLDRKDLKL